MTYDAAVINVRRCMDAERRLPNICRVKGPLFRSAAYFYVSAARAVIVARRIVPWGLGLASNFYVVKLETDTCCVLIISRRLVLIGGCVEIVGWWESGVRMDDKHDNCYLVEATVPNCPK